MSNDTNSAASTAKNNPLKTWGPLIAIAALMGLVFAMGWHKYLSLEQLGRNYGALSAYISDNLVLSLLAFSGLYIVVVALSLPGALALTLAGGLLFGWQIGGPVTVIAATIGATIIFLVAKTSLGDTLAAKAGPSIGKLREGFQGKRPELFALPSPCPGIPIFLWSTSRLPSSA